VLLILEKVLVKLEASLDIKLVFLVKMTKRAE